MPFLRRGEGGEKPRERGLLSVLFQGMGALRFCHASQPKRRPKKSTRKKFEKVFFMVVIVIFVSFVF